MDKIGFPFLVLPTELQVGIINRVWQYSDLQALCLVSKHVSDIATPRLYYEVEISNNIEKIINTLLIKPANLRFVRVLTTPYMLPEDSLLMDRLLPQFRKDFLTEINFYSACVQQFPTPQQMEFLWCHQKNLRNLQLGTHLFPWLDEFSKEQKPGRSTIFKFFTNVQINGNFGDENFQYIDWPLRNLDLSVLQKLTFTGGFDDNSIFTILNASFACGCFVNLTKLTFRHLRNFDQTLTLTNMPSLKLLVVDCYIFQGPTVPLVLADDIRLSTLTYNHILVSDIEKFIPLLAQAIGIEYLSITCENKVTATNKTQRDLVRAIIMHKDTLRGLHLSEELALQTDLDIWLWDSFIVKAIQIRCKSLVDLSFPFIPKTPVSYYCNLITSFPDLVSLTIWDKTFSDEPIWNNNSALELFSASTRLESVYIKKHTHMEMWSFVRKELVKML